MQSPSPYFTLPGWLTLFGIGLPYAFILAKRKSIVQNLETKGFARVRGNSWSKDFC